MLLTFASSLLAIWCLCLATSHTLNGFVHLAPFFALVAFFMRMLTGKLSI